MTVDYAEDAAREADAPAQRGPFLPVLGRGLRKRCPKCGEGRVFRSYLKIVTVCESCGEELGTIRADDFPPYLTMFLVGHIVVPLILIAEKLWEPTTWQHLAVWPLLSLVLILVLLSPVKGACVATLWHLRLKGDEFQ